MHLGLICSSQFESDLLQSAMIAVGISQYPFLFVAVQEKKEITYTSINRTIFFLAQDTLPAGLLSEMVINTVSVGI